jgi:3-(3-hydroxy-phenyl)propionate hydroxylase
MSEMPQKDEIRRQYVAMISGLDIRYKLGAGHPLLGRRIPDLDLVTDQGPLRVYTLPRDGHGAFINFNEPSRMDFTRWAGRVRIINAKYEGIWKLPGIETVAPPSAVLLRPDGYVAWVGDLTQPGLLEALS